MVTKAGLPLGNSVKGRLNGWDTMFHQPTFSQAGWPAKVVLTLGRHPQGGAEKELPVVPRLVGQAGLCFAGSTAGKAAALPPGG